VNAKTHSSELLHSSPYSTITVAAADRTPKRIGHLGNCHLGQVDGSGKGDPAQEELHSIMMGDTGAESSFSHTVLRPRFLRNPARPHNTMAIRMPSAVPPTSPRTSTVIV